MRLIWISCLWAIAVNVWSADSVCSAEGTFRTTNGCMPVVFVVRHAEDTPTGPHALTAEGAKHAQLYIMMFNNFIWENTRAVGKDKSQVCVCPIGKIISISNKGGDVQPRNPNPNPSSNPYMTVEPLSQSLAIPITTDNGVTQYWSSFQWTAEAKKKLFDDMGNLAQYSVVIAWDKQGLNASQTDYQNLVGWLTPPESQVPYTEFTPLLKYFPSIPLTLGSPALDPQRTNLWVYSDQNEQGKFLNIRFYQQMFYGVDCKSNPSLAPTLTAGCIVPQARDY